jgi:ABC-type Fe2+-enterobactin transport system substrate-binding protein
MSIGERVATMLRLAPRLRDVTRITLENNAHIVGAQWAQVAEVRSLEELDVNETQISAAAAACLAKLPRLRVLRAAELDDASRARLQEALPKCSINPRGGDDTFWRDESG